MSNRAQRRQAMREQIHKSKALIAEYTLQQKIEGLYKNGITEADLRQEYERGRTEGFKSAAINIVKCCYAGIVIALHDEFGFGVRRAFRAIRAVDQKVNWALTHHELAEEALEKTGLKLNFEDPFERVSMEDGNAKAERTKN